MLDIAVYLHLPGSYTKSSGSNSVYIPSSPIRYILYRSDSEDSDFIYDMSLKLEANRSGSFNFSILPSHTYYSTIRRFVHYVSVEDTNDNEVLFYGRVYSMTSDFAGTKQIIVEGIMSNLVDCPMYNPNLTSDVTELEKVFKVEGNPKTLFEMAIKAYRNLIRPDIMVGTIHSDAGTYEMEEIDVGSGQTVGDFIINQLVEAHGGYLRVRYEKDDYNNILVYLDWLADPSMGSSFQGSLNDQTIQFGVNLLDLSGDISDADIMTGIVPTWTDEENGKHWAVTSGTDVDNDGTTMLKPYVVSGTDGIANVGIQLIDLPELTDQSEAISVAKRYADRYCNYELSLLEFDSYEVKALDLHYFGSSDMPKFRLYDRVKLYSAYHALNQVLTCTGLSMNFDNPSENSYTLSIYRPKASGNDKTLCHQLGIKESKKRKVHNS